MAFNSLPTTLQNVLIEHNSYVSKWFVFLVLVALSSYYLFFIWKEQEPTKFFTVVIFRLFLLGFSVAYLVASPLLIINLSPEISFLEFYGVALNLYLIIMAVGLVVLLADLLRYGVLGVLKLGGLDFGDGNVKELIRTFENNKHFLKIKRSKKYR